MLSEHAAADASSCFPEGVSHHHCTDSTSPLAWLSIFTTTTLISVGIAAVLVLSTTEAQSHTNPHAVLHIRSNYAFEQTVERAQRVLEHTEGIIFFRLETAESFFYFQEYFSSSAVNILFSLEKIDRVLFQSNPSFALTIPHRLTIWDDNNSVTWLSVVNPYSLIGTYRLRNKRHLIEGMYRITEETLRTIAH